MLFLYGFVEEYFEDVALNFLVLADGNHLEQTQKAGVGDILAVFVPQVLFPQIFKAVVKIQVENHLVVSHFHECLQHLHNRNQYVFVLFQLLQLKDYSIFNQHSPTSYHLSFVQLHHKIDVFLEKTSTFVELLVNFAHK